MARILLSAYACEPDRGSEPGVGWGWATEAAALGHQIWVLTRANNRHSIEQHALSKAANVTFLYYDLPQWVRRCRLFFGKHIYYVLWQWRAVRQIRRLFPRLPFDRVQHVTYASVRYPSFMGGLGIPFCFGPVSGGETVPRQLRSGLSPRQRCRERLRDFWNLLVPWDPLMRWVFASAEKILLTPSTQSLVPRRWSQKCVTSLAIGLTAEHMMSCDEAEDIALAPASPQPFRLLFVGRLLEWKGIDIALRAVSRLRKSRPDVSFMIVGEGPARSRLTKLADELKLQDVVVWQGWLPQRLLQTVYKDADVFLYPSLRDSGAMVVLEALARGLPVVTTDLGGPGEIVDHHCGRVISTAGRNRDQLVDCFSTELADIAARPNLRESLARGARKRAGDFRFDKLVRSLYPAATVAVAGARS